MSAPYDSYGQGEPGGTPLSGPAPGQYPSYPQDSGYGQGQGQGYQNLGYAQTQSIGQAAGAGYGAQNPGYGAQAPGYGPGPGYAQGQYGPYPQGPYVQPGYAPYGGPRGYLQGGPVGFTEAVKQAISNIFTYQGRASRSAYWWVILANCLVMLAAEIILVIFTALHVAVLGDLIFVGALIAVFLVSLSLLVRRLHDSDKSGWFALLELIPFVGGIVLLVFALLDGTPGPNRFG